MMIWRCTVLLLLSLGLAACGGMVSPPAPVNKPAVSDKPAPADKPKEAAAPIDVGDIEASLRIVPTVAAESATANVKTEALKDQEQRVLMTTANVSAPFPKEFKVTFSFECARMVGQAPVAMRVKLFRDKEPFAAFAMFFDYTWFSTPYERTLDVLAGLASVPASMLVHGEAELILLPAGTDVSMMDPTTVTGTPDTTGFLTGSPLRINFGSGESTP